MQAVTQRPGIEINGEAVMRAGIHTWVTGSDSNRAIQARYGRRDYQITTQGPRPAQAFNLAVDQQAVKKIVDEIAEMKKAKRDREGPHTALLERHKDSRDHYPIFKQRIVWLLRIEVVIRSDSR